MSEEKPMEKCRLSKTEDGSCACYKKNSLYADVCRAGNHMHGLSILGFEVCPFPSKNHPVKSEWDERAERACEAYLKKCGCGCTVKTAKQSFINALRAEGFK